jgi:hypothetical protein
VQVFSKKMRRMLGHAVKWNEEGVVGVSVSAWLLEILASPSSLIEKVL